ncbi:fructose-1,6-bisphosphatase [Hujiaoplasma nucleasis]|uniref:Fructose-1,6-bisphosphatase n=1 Tax=Hujiaoplasma nucleasis TaxID=2725268 RepID=A0A7L6N612_9MOLU|nr:fructose-1,6-bisphosphatase [Hujiaoplasma nucleasis]QLY39934.1 fructose-1,6-bisphosphatase [Hujiaoplasma nucleasis]
MPYQNKYLELLSKDFPSVQAVSTELINLSAILNLPKGTEVFITDIHGEYDAFNHYLKNASGIIKEKIDQLFPDLSDKKKNQVAFFIYYPTDMLDKYQNSLSKEDYQTLIENQLYYMVQLAKNIVSKYTKSKVGKSLPKEFSYIIQELIYESRNNEDKNKYYDAIISAIFKTKRENKFILELSRFIRNMAIDQWHIVGDIFDRGPKPHMIMEKLLRMKNVDIQWGNHDIVFLGAACGSEVMIANMIRIAARYNNLDTFEDGYGINLLPLARLADKYYRHDPCEIFYPKDSSTINSLEDLSFIARIHKAISIIQFKLEATIIKRHPEFEMDDRLLLDKIDYKNNTLSLNNQNYKLIDQHFPTINPKDPYRLNDDEMNVIKHLKRLVLHNEMIQSHAKYLIDKGRMYLIYNHNLLFHAAIPFKDNGDFASMDIEGRSYSGRDLLDRFDKLVRSAYYHRYDEIDHEEDYFMYLWQGKYSPLFAKSAMKTFERYFLKDKSLHKEVKNPYFTLRENEEILQKIYDVFSLNPQKSKIINGHVPLDITKGDGVVLANKRIYNIDGGMSKQYSNETSFAGYSLISDSYAYFLVSHERFNTYKELIEKEKDIFSVTRSEEINPRRTYIYDTNKGEELKSRINDLFELLNAYREGEIVSIKDSWTVDPSNQ